MFGPSGASLLSAFYFHLRQLELGVNKLASVLNPLQGCLIEAISTFLLVFVIFASTDGGRKDLKGSAALAIGLCVPAVALFAGPLTGCSLNPARTLAPSIAAGHFENHWVYWIGPLLGGVVAGLLYHHVFRVKNQRIVAREPDVEFCDK
ncbi:Aquaporin [Orchesella cincta]|uniref:Aquaporin n=1 Tax=Orchesella cincta TaxID=48709 RepID=A0A1D2M477_ORCCI|nr:Aquaporin [Orchesella cincta]